MWIDKKSAPVIGMVLYTIRTSIIQLLSRISFCGQVNQDTFHGSVCVGSCGLYRRDALTPFGGVAPISHSEDMYTGFKMAELGYRVRFSISCMFHLRKRVRWYKEFSGDPSSPDWAFPPATFVYTSPRGIIHNFTKVYRSFFLDFQQSQIRYIWLKRFMSISVRSTLQKSSSVEPRGSRIRSGVPSLPNTDRCCESDSVHHLIPALLSQPPFLRIRLVKNFLYLGFLWFRCAWTTTRL